MGLFKKETDQQKKMKALLKEREKNEKKMEKQLEARMNSKYTAETMKAAKSMMMKDAMNIDALEYQKIAQELKERMKKG